jgi:PAS domain S-box-containing protein
VNFKAMTATARRGNIARAVLSSLPALISVLDDKGVIIHVNESWLKFGLDHGVSDHSLISPGINYLDICQRGVEANLVEAKLVRDGIVSVLNGSENIFELEYLSRCDSYAAWFCVTVTPLQLSGGGAVVSHGNITRHVEQVRQHRKSEQDYRALIDNALDILKIIDSQGKVLYVNPALERVLGYAPENLIGSFILDKTHPRDQNRIRRMLRRLQSEPDLPHREEFRIRDASGKWRYLEVIGKGLRNSGREGNIILSCRDLTERRQAEMELQRKEAALQRSHAQLRALTGRVLVAEDEARRRISRDLHDDLNQRLAMIAVDLGKISGRVPTTPAVRTQQDLSALQAEVSKLSNEARRTAHHLHPSSLDDLGLVVAVRSLCEEFSQRNSVDVRFAHRCVPESLPAGVRSSMYRIVQESLWNVASHAKTAWALVSLSGTDTGLRVSIRDRGAGFDPGSPSGKGGLGLISIEERARLLGGTLRIRSRPGLGCRLTVDIPIGQQ